MRKRGVVEEMGVGEGGHEDSGKVWYLWRVRFEDCEYVWEKNTVSPRRAMTGRSVGAASRWRSTPSKTRMNFPRSSSNCCSSTTKALMLSHLALPLVSTSSSFCLPSLPLIEAIVRSRRCRVVMHSWDRMMADGI